MSNIDIYHQRTDPFMTCNGDDICSIVLVNTDYKIRGKKKNLKKVKFKRINSEAQAGFKIVFDPAFNGQTEYTTTNPNLIIDLADEPDIDEYKYTISYPYDVGAKVAPLDPIIIIEGDSSINLVTAAFASVLAFIFGAASMFFLR